MHQVGVLAMHGFVPFDLTIPCEVFTRARKTDGKHGYRVLVCGEEPEVRAEAFTLRAPHGLDRLSRVDTLIIPGIEDSAQPISAAVLAAIRRGWKNGARIASVCSGAFVLAATGLLDGHRATTHWRGTDELARRFPLIEVDPDVLFVDEGRLITSAGSSAGLDMCMHLVRRDYGQAAATYSARMAVAPLERDGGQAQFIQYESPHSNASLQPLLEWMRKNLRRPLDIAELATRACVSPRTLARRFVEQTGTTPLQWLIRSRVALAQQLLETTSQSIDRIALATGFDATVTFRARFRRIVGVSPSVYRQRFNSRGER